MTDINCGLFIPFLALLLVPNPSLQQRCATTDDLGRTSCVLLTPYYSEYQWATCLTDDYIMRASDQRHLCLDRTATQCWYQCMLELNDLEQGPVYEDCSCSPNEMPMTVAPTDDLPPHCYSPEGNDCHWYRECLEARYPCEGSNAGYAIEYAEKFCNLYSENYNDFTTSGRAWVDGVRKCLQVALVPFLRPFVAAKKTCSDLRTEAFDSHPDCYINPASDTPGICQLPCSDVVKSFWIVSFEGGALTSAPAETAQQMLSVMVGCFGMNPFSGCIPATIQTGLLITLGSVFRSISAAVRVVNIIAVKQKWESNGFRWIPLVDGEDDMDTNDRNKRQTTDSADTFNVKVLLADAKLLNITNGTRMTQPEGQNLNQAVEMFANAVKNGEFSDIALNLDGTETVLNVLSIGQCNDILCNSTNVTELAVAPSPSNAAAVKHALFMQQYAVALISLVMIFLLAIV